MEAQAFAEVYDIINHFEPQMYQKISKKFIDLIEKNKDDNYEVDIDYSQDINDQIKIRETKVILSIIYRDFICDKKLKQKLEQYDYNKIEAKKMEKYNPNNLFKNGETVKRIEKETIVETAENTNKNAIEKTSVVEYKENFFTKFKNFILKLLHIKS